MPLTTIPLPFGLRDVKVSPVTGGVATAVDLPNSQTFQFSEAEDTTQLRGDDGLVAIHGKGPVVDWQLSGGGISLEALLAFDGGTLTTTGTTPAQVKTFSKKGTDVRPYVRVEGQAISDSGGDFHVVLYKCRATGNITGEMADGAFWVTGLSGIALPNLATGALYDFVQNETAAAIAATGTWAL
jgi:hypothetical protein